MGVANRHRFDGKATAYRASAVDRHKTPLPPGRCRALPEMSHQQQVVRLFAAHQGTKDVGKQAAADSEYDAWDTGMDLLQKEEELEQERSAHADTKRKLWATEDKLDAATEAAKQKDDKIASLLLQLSVVLTQRDEASAVGAGLRTSLQAAEGTITEQAHTISNMGQQLSSHIASMSLLHRELSIQGPPAPNSAQLQQSQTPEHYAGLFGRFQGSVPTPSSATTMLPDLREHSTASSTTIRSSTAGNPPPVPAPALQPLPCVSAPTAAPTTEGAPDADMLDTIKATSTVLLTKTSQGVRQGWTKAVAWGVDNGIKLGLPAATHQPNLGCNSGASSVLMSRWGSLERWAMSAAPSRRCSNSSSFVEGRGSMLSSSD